MIVYGRNAVREALRGSRTVSRIWATKNALREQWLSEAAVVLEAVGADQLGQLCGSPEHQGVCAEVSAFRYAGGEVLLAADRPVLALDQVQDPQNLGAICRSAECAGAAGVVLPERGAAHVTPAVCRASAGAVEHLPIARVRNLADFLGEAKRAGAWVYGTEADAETPYWRPDYG